MCSCAIARSHHLHFSLFQLFCIFSEFLLFFGSIFMEQGRLHDSNPSFAAPGEAWARCHSTAFSQVSVNLIRSRKFIRKATTKRKWKSHFGEREVTVNWNECETHELHLLLHQMFASARAFIALLIDENDVSRQRRGLAQDEQHSCLRWKPTARDSHARRKCETRRWRNRKRNKISQMNHNYMLLFECCCYIIRFIC